jgi:hypothetical protein
MIRVLQGLEMFFMLKQYRIVCQVTNVVLSLDVTAVIDSKLGDETRKQLLNRNSSRKTNCAISTYVSGRYIDQRRQREPHGSNET